MKVPPDLQCLLHLLLTQTRHFCTLVEVFHVACPSRQADSRLLWIITFIVFLLTQVNPFSPDILVAFSCSFQCCYAFKFLLY